MDDKDRLPEAGSENVNIPSEQPEDAALPVDEASSQPSEPQKPKKKMKRVWKVLITILCILLSLILLLGGIAYVVFARYYSLLDVQPREETLGDYEDIIAALKRGEMPDTSGLTPEELARLEQAWQTYLQIMEEERENSYAEDPNAPVVDPGELKDYEDENTPEPIPEENREDKLINVLLIGKDLAGGVNNASRSDAMILVTVNPYQKTIYLTSFLRDTYAYIPGIGWDKMNHSYVFGGASLVMETLEQNFGCVIDNYVTVDFSMFQDIVDLVGGVDVEVTKAELSFLRDHTGAKLKTSGGKLHMDGDLALTYARVRSIDSDVMRTERQRKVISAMVQKAKGMDIVKLLELMEVILPMVETDLSQGDCLSLLYQAVQFRTYSVVSQRIPADKTYSSMYLNDYFYWKVDFEANRQFWKKTAGKTE